MTESRLRLLVLISQILSLCAFVVFREGILWIDTGHGLHPMIATVVGMLCLYWPHLLISLSR